MASFNRSNYEQDSLIICDGLTPLKYPVYAGGGVGGGRFVFILGDVEYYADDILENEFAKFAIDIVDMFLSKRTRLAVNCDLYSFGDQCGFYAIDEKTLVVISHNQEEQILRQWLVRINYESETAHCDLYRRYAMIFSNDFPPQTTIGEESAIVATEVETYIIPINPLSSKLQRDIRPLINRAAVNLAPLYRPGIVNTTDFFIGDIPFFITSTVIGCFVKVSENGEGRRYDLMTIAVLDLTNGSAYLQEVSSSSGAPLVIERLRIPGITWEENGREVVVFGRRNDQVIFFGVLNTRFLEFTEIKACGGPDYTLRLVAFSDCIIVADQVREGTTGDRVAGNGQETWGMKDRFRLIRHPLRVPSLTQLASIAVQNSGRLEMLQLQQISDRLC